MKNIFLFLFFYLFIVTADACHISFKIKDEKPVYHQNDEVIVVVRLELEHRNCDVKPSETLFKTNELKVVSSKEWKQVGPSTYEREFRLLIAGKSGQGMLAAKRECHKEGALGSVLFKIE
jgi:hypothetical protein